MIVRRAGEYGYMRPGREMLWTAVTDSVVYRAGDMASAWVKTGVDALSGTPALAMLVGAAVCVAWAANGHLLAKAQARLESGSTPAA